jgi:hypothetical protein
MTFASQDEEELVEWGESAFAEPPAPVSPEEAEKGSREGSPGGSKEGSRRGSKEGSKKVIFVV